MNELSNEDLMRLVFVGGKEYELVKMEIMCRLQDGRALLAAADGDKGEAVAAYRKALAAVETAHNIYAAEIYLKRLLVAAESAPQAECAPTRSLEVIQAVADLNSKLPPLAECAPRDSNESAYQRGYLDGMAKGRRDAQIDAAESAPREAQPNWKALHAAADAVAASADIWAGFSTQDAKVCVDAYLAAPTPERAQRHEGYVATSAEEVGIVLDRIDSERALAKKEGA